MNKLHIDTDGPIPEYKFYGVNIENVPVKTFTQCSVHGTFWTADSIMRIQLDRQNGNQDQTFMYIMDTLRFTPEVLH